MTETRHPDDGPVSSSPGYMLGDLVRYALQLGTLGFGGPVAQMGTARAGPTDATVAALVIFQPCYLFTIIPAPYFRKHGRRPGIVAFVEGVTAAAVGAIAGACIVLGRRTLFEAGWTLEIPKLVILLVTMAPLLRFKKLPEPLVIAGAAIVGLLMS